MVVVGELYYGREECRLIVVEVGYSYSRLCLVQTKYYDYRPCKFSPQYNVPAGMGIVEFFQRIVPV